MNSSASVRSSIRTSSVGSGDARHEPSLIDPDLAAVRGGSPLGEQFEHAELLETRSRLGAAEPTMMLDERRGREEALRPTVPSSLRLGCDVDLQRTHTRQQSAGGADEVGEPLVVELREIGRRQIVEGLVDEGDLHERIGPRRSVASSGSSGLPTRFRRLPHANKCTGRVSQRWGDGNPRGAERCRCVRLRRCLVLH